MPPEKDAPDLPALSDLWKTGLYFGLGRLCLHIYKQLMLYPLRLRHGVLKAWTSGCGRKRTSKHLLEVNTLCC